MLFVTLPQVHQDKLLEKIVAHPTVGAVRYNTGTDSAYSPEETLGKILEHTKRHGKPLYVDLKGRQLRVTEWATLPYGPIVLNHRIKVSLPAKVCFRGDDCVAIKEAVDGNKLYVDPLPKYPVGRGQAVNILADSLEIEGGLLDNDRAYIKAAAGFGIPNFMLSFVEDLAHVRELTKEIVKYHVEIGEVVLKIESDAGVRFVKRTPRKMLGDSRLMAARDDLMIQIGAQNMLNALRVIIGKDPSAICASRLLLGLEHSGVSMADVSDIELMRLLGYKNFMLSDGISREHFDKAVGFWKGL